MIKVTAKEKSIVAWIPLSKIVAFIENEQGVILSVLNGEPSFIVESIENIQDQIDKVLAARRAF